MLPSLTLHKAMKVAVTATSTAITELSRDSLACSTASWTVSWSSDMVNIRSLGDEYHGFRRKLSHWVCRANAGFSSGRCSYTISRGRNDTSDRRTRNANRTFLIVPDTANLLKVGERTGARATNEYGATADQCIEHGLHTGIFAAGRASCSNCQFARVCGRKVRARQ